MNVKKQDYGWWLKHPLGKVFEIEDEENEDLGDKNVVVRKWKWKNRRKRRIAFGDSRVGKSF